MRIFIAMLLAVFVTSVSAALPPVGTEFHALSFRVVVNDTEVMTPSVHVLSGKPATISLQDDKTGNRYKLSLVVTEGVKAPGSDREAVGIETKLWTHGNERKLVDSVLLVDPKQERPASSMMIGPDGRKTGVEVVSHRVQRLTAEQATKLSAKKPSVSACQEGGCCGGPCTD